MNMKLIVRVNGFDESIEYVRNLIGRVKLDTMIFMAASTNRPQEMSGDNNISVFFEEV